MRDLHEWGRLCKHSVQECVNGLVMQIDSVADAVTAKAMPKGACPGPWVTSDFLDF